MCVQVEAMQRRAAYERDQLLARIQSDTEKAVGLLQQRTALQDQRRAANMEASFQRQRLMQVCPLQPIVACRRATRHSLISHTPLVLSQQHRAVNIHLLPLPAPYTGAPSSHIHIDWFIVRPS